MKPTVALVFVATNEKDLLVEALQSLDKSSHERGLEIVVVDNDSSDGLADEINKRWPDAKVVRRDQNHGLPSNLNRGIEESTAPYVVLCNCDLDFQPGSVEALAEFLDTHPRAAIAAPKLLSPTGETRPSARRWYTFWSLLMLKGPWKGFTTQLRSVRRNVYDDWDYGQPRLVDWVPCSATMFRREAFDEVGLMDERFRLYFDDVDISLRMHEAGWEVWCVPEAEIVHLEQRSSLRAFSRAWRWHLDSLVRFWWKHRRLSPRRN